METDGNPLGKVSLTALMWDPNIESADTTKLEQIVFNTRFRYLENICDHSCHTTKIHVN